MKSASNFLITRHWWLLLANPARKSPLYWRTVTPRIPPEWMQQWQKFFSPIAPLVYLFTVMFVCCAVTSRSLGIFLFIAAAFVILGNGTMFGLMWSVTIASELAKEREQGAWELLCLQPSGGLGAAWAMATGIMHRDNAFRSRYQRHINILRAILTIVAIVAFGSLLDARSVYNVNVVMIYAYIIAGTLASYVDYVQSTVLGGLTGVIAGTFTRTRLDAQLRAVGAFLLLQTGAYALVVLIGVWLLPRLLSLGGFTPGAWTTEITLLILRVVFFVGLRELVIVGLWRVVAERLNTTTQQLETLRL
jgi:hypothetical protein